MKECIIEFALGQYGIKEIAGDEDNPEILKYFAALGFDGEKLKDETAWCSAFANWVAIQAGCHISGKLNARSWLNVGKEVKSPEIGDVIVLWRESKDSWKGHVGFYIGEDDTHYFVLGGNQSNAVNIKPYAKYRLLSFRDITK